MSTAKAAIDRTVDYITSKEAIAALGVKPETFYTYAGRGWIRRLPHPDGKHSLYSREDIERIRARSNARAGHAVAAAGAMHWGEPVIETSITELTPAGPRYRGRLAVDLAGSGYSFESAAELLWSGEWTGEATTWPCSPLPFDPDQLVGEVDGFDPGSEILEVLSMVTMRACITARRERLTRPANSGLDNLDRARQIIKAYAGCIGYLSAERRFVAGCTGASVAAQIARITDRLPAARTLDAINAALIISADHELSASTFAARLAASTGADYFSCLGVALNSHAGGNIRGNCDDAEDMVLACSDRTMFRDLIERLKQSARRIPGFNHPFYPKGDPRALYLLDIARALGARNGRVDLIFEFVEEAALRLRAYPSIALGLIAVCSAIGLPKRSAGLLWAIGWTAGWSAHIIEQLRAGYMMRPRAKYVKRNTLS